MIEKKTMIPPKLLIPFSSNVGDGSLCAQYVKNVVDSAQLCVVMVGNMSRSYAQDPTDREVNQSIRAIIDCAVKQVQTDYGKPSLSELRLLATVYLRRCWELLEDGDTHRFFVENGRLRWEEKPQPKEWDDE